MNNWNNSLANPSNPLSPANPLNIDQNEGKEYKGVTIQTDDFVLPAVNPISVVGSFLILSILLLLFFTWWENRNKDK